MSAIRCETCRWWAGGKNPGEEMFEHKKRGSCERIVASAAMRDDTAARIYPVDSGAVLSTRYDFSCAQWEKP